MTPREPTLLRGGGLSCHKDSDTTNRLPARCPSGSALLWPKGADSHCGAQKAGPGDRGGVRKAPPAQSERTPGAMGSGQGTGVRPLPGWGASAGSCTRWPLAALSALVLKPGAGACPGCCVPSLRAQGPRRRPQRKRAPGAQPGSVHTRDPQRPFVLDTCDAVSTVTPLSLQGASVNGDYRILEATGTHALELPSQQGGHWGSPAAESQKEPCASPQALIAALEGGGLLGPPEEARPW